MFETVPILWLQSFSSPTLTTVMNGVSWLGYVSSCVAIAAIVACGWRLRAGVVVLLAIAIAALTTNAAKSALKWPRPDAADARVQALSTFPNTSDPSFGFPSGHVAATTALVGGVWWFGRRRWLLVPAAAAVVLMAVSRMYLGRHFPGDVIGGFGIGVASVFVAWQALRLNALVGLAVCVALVALVMNRLVPADTGRLFGFAVAAWALVKWDLLDESRSASGRAARVAVVLVFVGLAFGAPIEIGRIAGSRLVTFTAAAVLNASILLAPAFLSRITRSS